MEGQYDVLVRNARVVRPNAEPEIGDIAISDGPCVPLISIATIVRTSIKKMEAVWFTPRLHLRRPVICRRGIMNIDEQV